MACNRSLLVFKALLFVGRLVYELILQARVSAVNTEAQSTPRLLFFISQIYNNSKNP